MPTAIDAEAFAHYLDALTADTIAAMCGDYRASFWLDRNHDAEDRQAGRRIECPTLVVTGARRKPPTPRRSGASGRLICRRPRSRADRGAYRVRLNPPAPGGATEVVSPAALPGRRP